MKTATLESKFPLLSVEHGCIVSKDADITVAYKVELPELFTLTKAEYEAVHSTWAKAVKVLPNYSIVHKQDFFIEEGYKPDICKEDLSFLSRSFERHFNERPYLQHTCYLFLTKTTKEHSRTTSSFNALTRGFIIPKEIGFCPIHIIRKRLPDSFSCPVDHSTKLFSKDGKAKATIWNSYGKTGKRSGKTVVATAKKNRKINVKKATKTECSYSYKMGKNTIQYCYVFIKNGEIAFQLTYPTASKKYYSAAAKGMMASLKKNKSLTLND